jgi:hypothetical protein
MRLLSLTVTGLIKMEVIKEITEETSAIYYVIKGSSFAMANSPCLTSSESKPGGMAQHGALDMQPPHKF